MNRIQQNFFIKPGYEAGETSAYYEDNLVDNEGVLHQPDVYELARHVAPRFGCTRILDIGCGRGEKLIKLHPQFEVIGIDFGVNINHCRSHYNFGQWQSLDLELPHLGLMAQDELSRTLVVCSDVIEHLVDPTGLLLTLKNLLVHAPVAILSTPERDLVRGVADFGPPSNPAHVREWNLDELADLLDAFSFQVAFIGLTRNNDRDSEKKTILSVLHGARLPQRETIVDDDFRVVAIMTAYNEEDIIVQSVKHLLQTGVEVYLIDNWSCDNTVALVEPFLGKGLIGIERFPPEGGSDVYDWGRLLGRVEELAGTIPADWIIHQDVDEIRESPWRELTVREALYYVESMGFNAVDHTVINFRPINNNFTKESDLAGHFSYWEFGRRPGHFLQIKAWKNEGKPLSLVQSGGHEANFPGRKVFPYKFLLRHYPIRSQNHGEKKVFLERKPRFSEAEHSMSWHTQYDDVKLGDSFICDANELTFFDPVEFDKEYLVERISGIGIAPLAELVVAESALSRIRQWLGVWQS